MDSIRTPFLRFERVLSVIKIVVKAEGMCILNESNFRAYSMLP